jgi:hypothetical protein
MNNMDVDPGIWLCQFLPREQELNSTEASDSHQYPSSVLDRLQVIGPKVWSCDKVFPITDQYWINLH